MHSIFPTLFLLIIAHRLLYHFYVFGCNWVLSIQIKAYVCLAVCVCVVCWKSLVVSIIQFSMSILSFCRHQSQCMVYWNWREHAGNRIVWLLRNFFMLLFFSVQEEIGIRCNSAFQYTLWWYLFLILLSRNFFAEEEQIEDSSNQVFRLTGNGISNKSIYAGQFHLYISQLFLTYFCIFFSILPYDS